MKDNRFDNKGNGDQNIAQGDHAVGKQVNDNRSTTQTIYITNKHYPTAGAVPTCLLPAEDDIFLHREAELSWLDKHLHGQGGCHLRTRGHGQDRAGCPCGTRPGG